MQYLKSLIVSLLLFLFVGVVCKTTVSAATTSFVDQGVWLVNGQRFFPIALYYTPGDQSDLISWNKMKNNGFNSSITSPNKLYMDNATDSSIYTIPSFTYLPQDTWETTVLARKTHTSLIAWYGHDEPCLFPYSEQDLARHKKLNATLDPDHPIYVYNYCTSNVTPVFDGKGSIAGSGTVNNGDIAQYAIDGKVWHDLVLADKLKAAMVNIHAASTDAKNTNHMLALALAGIAGGANGITFFDENCASRPDLNGNCSYEAHFDKISTVAKFLQSIYPGLVGTNPRYKVSNGIYWMRRLGTDGKNYIVAVNTDSDAKSVAVGNLTANQTYVRKIQGDTVVTTGNGVLNAQISGKTAEVYVEDVYSYAPEPYGGHKFIWIKNNRAGFTEEEMQIIAHNYDLVVIGNMHAEGNRDIEYADVRRLKEINPKLPIFLYFPTKLRHENATYGLNDFQDAWYLKNLDGSYYIDEEQGLRTVDITIPEYRDWAIKYIRQFLNAAPYEGVAMDNASPIKLQVGKIEKLGEAKIIAINTALDAYLTQLTKIANNRNMPLIHNSVGAKQPASRANIAITNGGLDEGFCVNYAVQEGETQKSPSIKTAEEQIEDINFEYNAGKEQKIVLQVTHFTEPDTAGLPLDQYGRYCYGVFLMGHVEGYTFFKLGNGYSLHAEPQHTINAEEIDLPLGHSRGRYQNTDYLLSRKFDNGYAIVNLSNQNQKWILPEKLEEWTGNTYKRTLNEGQSISIYGLDAKYFLRPGVIIPTPSPTPVSLPGDINTDGIVNILDQTLLSNAFGTNNPSADLNTDGTVNILDYTILSTNFGKAI